MDEPTEKFLIEVELRSHPSNEASTLDPEDFVDFLQRFVVDAGASYGLDAYNKDAPQLVAGIRLLEKPKDSSSGAEPVDAVEERCVPKKDGLAANVETILARYRK